MKDFPNDTAPIAMSGEPLAETEIARLRRVLLDRDREEWAWKKIRVVTPGIIAIVTVFWQGWDWIVRHLKYN